MEYKRVVITKFGGPEVLKEISELELPEPDKGQVRIKVLATSASFTDTLIRRGIYPAVRKKPPFSPGYDLIGVIDKVGEGVTHLKKGQKIAELTVIGSYTEYICLEAKTLALVPNGLNDAESVSLVLSYLTAYQMLYRSAKIQAGQTILVHACSGAVGIAILQLGKLLNLKIYGTASIGKHDFIQKFGAIPIDYKNEDFVERLKTAEPNGIDAVFDPIGGPYFPRSLKVLKKSGTLVAFGYQSSASGNGGKVILDFLKIQFWNLLPTKPSANFYIITSWQFHVPPNAALNKSPVVQSWISYSLAKSTCQLQIGGDLPSENSSFKCELRPREVLVKRWATRNDVGAPPPSIPSSSRPPSSPSSPSSVSGNAEQDEYLDLLLRVRDAGFLEEYVWFYFRERDWPQPDWLKLSAFESWRVEHLAWHRPETRFIGYWTTPSS